MSSCAHYDYHGAYDGCSQPVGDRLLKQTARKRLPHQYQEKSMHKTLIRSFVTGILLVAAATTSAVDTQVHSATVLETMDSGGYTYVKVDEDGAVFWAAAPASEVSVGDTVTFTAQMQMANFTSRTLNRTFDELMFVGPLSGGSAASGSEPAESAEPMSASATVQALATVSEPIAKADGGYTVAEVFAMKDELKGKTVKVRGKVVKVSSNIMGLNWVHLQDGSGAEGSDRLIFRSAVGVADVGSVVTAEGTLDTDLDFGYGYKYSALVDDSTFTP